MNVVTSQPGVGDILCRDESGGYRFIQLDTFQAGTFPSAWETLGVVVWRRGNQVKVVSKHNEKRKWMDVYPYVVTGYQLDGAEHTAQLRLRGRPSMETFYEFRYTAITVDEFVTALQQFLAENGETDWSAYKDEQERVILQCDRYDTGSGLDSPSTQAVGISINGRVNSDLPMSPTFRRRCGNDGSGIWHAVRAKMVFRVDNPRESFNPTSDVSSVPLSPVCWPAFAGKSQYQSDHCMWLRQQYCKDPAHPTEAEWEAYIDDLRPRIPYMLGCSAPKWRDGAALSASLKGKIYRAADGEQKPLYPAVEYCAQFLDGRGYLPSMAELVECFGNVTYGLPGITMDRADPINRSLYAIGGSGISCSYSWMSTNYMYPFTNVNAYYEGNVWSSYMASENLCSPFALLELPAGAD